MANFEVDFPEDFMSGLLETDPDDICKEALTEVAPILENSMKSSLRAVIDHEGDSELVNSIKSSKPKKAKTGAWIVNVNPRGYSEKTYYAKYKGKHTLRKQKVANVMKAIWKEYGVAGRQPPKPFLAKAVNDVRDAGMDAIQKVYNKLTGAK